MVYRFREIGNSNQIKSCLSYSGLKNLATRLVQDQEFRNIYLSCLTNPTLFNNPGMWGQLQVHLKGTSPIPLQQHNKTVDELFVALNDVAQNFNWTSSFRDFGKEVISIAATLQSIGIASLSNHHGGRVYISGFCEHRAYNSQTGNMESQSFLNSFSSATERTIFGDGQHDIDIVLSGSGKVVCTEVKTSLSYDNFNSQKKQKLYRQFIVYKYLHNYINAPDHPCIAAFKSEAQLRAIVDQAALDHAHLIITFSNQDFDYIGLA